MSCGSGVLPVGEEIDNLCTAFDNADITFREALLRIYMRGLTDAMEALDG